MQLPDVAIHFTALASAAVRTLGYSIVKISKKCCSLRFLKVKDSKGYTKRNLPGLARDNQCLLDARTCFFLCKGYEEQLSLPQQLCTWVYIEISASSPKDLILQKTPRNFRSRCRSGSRILVLVKLQVYIL